MHRPHLCARKAITHGPVIKTKTNLFITVGFLHIENSPIHYYNALEIDSLSRATQKSFTEGTSLAAGKNLKH